MTTLFIILAFVAAIFLTLFVLIQNPKGGGLSPSMGGAPSQVFGVQRTTDILEKGTWILGGAVVVCSLAITFLVSSGGKPTQAESKIKQKIDQATIPNEKKEQAAPGLVPIGGDSLKK